MTETKPQALPSTGGSYTVDTDGALKQAEAPTAHALGKTAQAQAKAQASHAHDAKKKTKE